MIAIMPRMSRTTIMADDALLDQLRAIAAEEGISLGKVIRQGLEWRAKTRRRVPSFIGAIASDDRRGEGAKDIDELVGEYLQAKHARR
jgi:hypothetical protein